MAAPATPLPSSKGVESQNPNCSSNSPSMFLSPSPLRLWRPATQRNVRNQWLKLFSSKIQWASAMSEGRSHATSLVNAYLNHRYMSSVNLGAANDMPEIREKACQKLAHKQETYRNYLLSSYKNMISFRFSNLNPFQVLTVAELVKSAHSFRCFLKGPVAGPLSQFGDSPEHENDSGDGGGVSVFTFFSISHFENLAWELVEMFVSELSLKRFLVVEFLSLRCEGEGRGNKIKWSDELYIGEFDELKISGLCTENNIPPLFPQLRGQLSWSPLDTKEYHLMSSDVLQVSWYSRNCMLLFGITLRGDKCPAMMEVETLCPRKQGWKSFNGCEELLLHVEEECSGEAKLIVSKGIGIKGNKEFYSCKWQCRGAVRKC
ncbi:hypothetical protein ZIOFF_073854 [Zingiber officinale]|uniref:Uncharacterized protein n=1 Tax=Zingiber officinale TaxID=94328 RepID=A0A8J5EPL5_ZINOF|nr:hypothetical protein ZIOFF_073854 [Zingiber officinale]